MLLSIVTPSFNQSAFLEETIISVLRQDYAEIEYIIIDGGSTDGSVEIIKRYQGRLAFWTSEKDHGQVDAIMKGFNRATGDVFAWVNSDDVLAPSAGRVAMSCLKMNSDVGLVYGDRLHIDQKGNVIGVNQGPSFYSAMLRRDITIPQETAFFRRSLFEKSGGLDPTLHFALDFDLWCRMSQLTTFRHVPAFLGSYREHLCSKSIMLNNPTDRVSDKFKAEQAAVYRRYFRRPPPGRLQTKLYRFIHKARFCIERLGPAYRKHRQLIHESMAQPTPEPKR